MFGPGVVYCPAVSFTDPGWVPDDRVILDLIAGRELAVAGRLRVLCSAAAVTAPGLQLLADAGLSVEAELITFAGPQEYGAQLDRLQRAGARLAVQHAHPTSEIPPAAYLTSLGLLQSLNNKGELARFVPHALLPERHVFGGATEIPPAEVLLARGSVVLKVATDASSGGGYDVWICRTPAEVETMRGRIGRAERIVVESWFEMVQSPCLHFAVGPNGEVQYLGAAEQVSDMTGRYGGNWLDVAPTVPPAGVEAAGAVVEQAAALGYRGLVGIDVALLRDGSIKIYDLNFRVNGSTAAVLLLPELARTRGVRVARYRTWRAPSFPHLLAVAHDAVARGILLPLATCDPRVVGMPEAQPALAGVLLGLTRAELLAHEASLAARGLA